MLLPSLSATMTKHTRFTLFSGAVLLISSCISWVGEWVGGLLGPLGGISVLPFFSGNSYGSGWTHLSISALYD